MFNMGFNDNATSSDRENAGIRERAETKYGGTTTVSKVTQQIKLLAQKHDIADLVRIEKSTGGVTIRISDKARTRLHLNNRGDFYSELMNAIYDCGYNFSVGNDFFQIYKA